MPLSYNTSFHVHNKQKVIILAKKVEKQSEKYKNQLSECQRILSTNKFIIF